MMSPEMPVDKEDEINLYEYWRVIVARRNMILAVTVLSLIAAVAVTMMLPKVYLGEITVKLMLKDTSARDMSARDMSARDMSAGELLNIIGEIDEKKFSCSLIQAI